MEASDSWIEFGGSIGSQKNLYTAEVFNPINVSENRMFFCDAKISQSSHHVQDGSLAFGWRSLYGNAFILGGNISFDTTRTQATSTFHQLSFGFEWMTDYIEFRSHFLLPKNKRKVLHRSFVPERIVGLKAVGHHVFADKFFRGRSLFL